MAIGTTLKIAFDSANVKKGLSGINLGIGKMAGNLAKLGAAAVTASLAAAAAGILAFGVSSTKAAADTELVSVAFTTLIGSAEKANKVLMELRELGAKTPLEETDIMDAAKTLLAFGIEAEDVTKTIKMLGDVAMGDAEKLKSISLVFGQISSGGRLTGGDLLQLINVGFNPLQKISERTGESMLSLRKKMEGGQITFEMVREEFERATTEGGAFNKMMEKLAGTTSGKLSNLSDSITRIKVSLGNGINEGLNVALDAINGGLPKFTAAFTQLGKDIGTTISEAVQGDTTRLAAIGTFIGSVISESLTYALQSGFTNLGIDLVSGAKLAFTPDLLDSEAKAIVDKNISDKAYLQESRMADAIARLKLEYEARIKTDASAPIQAKQSDPALEKVTEKLEDIEKNTRTGAKM